jgi:guanylate kinase
LPSSSGKVFVITGPSGVGKGTLISGLLAESPGLEMSVSATTRQPREGELDGREYHFLSSAEFGRRVAEGDFLEHAAYSGNQYGTLRSEVEARLTSGISVVLEIELQGARQIRESMPQAIQIFIAPPDSDALRSRLEGRGTDTPEAISERLRTAEVEMAAQGEFPNVVVNDDVQKAREELVALVQGQLPLD